MIETRKSRLAAEGTPLQQLNFETFVREAREAPWERRGEFYRRFLILLGEADDNFTQGQAEYIDELYRARTAPGREPAGERPRRARDPASQVGSRPRTKESLDRRRSYVSGGFLPDGFLPGRRWGILAVLSYIATQVLEHARCTAFVGEIGAHAGYCDATVHEALRLGRDRGWIRVEHRRRPGALRNESNVVTIVDKAWLAWLRVRVEKWRRVSKRAAAFWRLPGYNFAGASSTRDRSGVGLKADNLAKRAPFGAPGLSRGETARTGPSRPPRVAPA